MRADLGATVLVLLDRSYGSRFWTQFESWLSMQIACSAGLISAAEHMRRCDIVNLKDCPDDYAMGIINEWSNVTTEKAKEKLRKEDIFVTNAKDKDSQLDKLTQFNTKVVSLGLGRAGAAA